MGAKRRLEIGGLGLAGKEVEMQGHAHEHPLPKIADRGDEDRAARQAAIGHDFRNMLVLEAEAIKLEGRRVLASWAAIIDLPPPE